ncbi:MAG: LamG domain-containing protein [Spirochaetes bacterium]|nr:LamG domain-containing protein [Spirochaetota bacterium]
MKPILGTQINPAQLLSHKLIAGWVFNERAGIYCKDISENNNRAQFYSGHYPVWQKEGLDFGVINDSQITIESPNIPNIGTGQYTIFTKINYIRNNFSGLFNFYDGLQQYNPSWGINDSYKMYIYDSSWEGYSTSILDTGIVTLAWVRQGIGTGQVKLYINGILDAQITHSDSINKPTKLDIGSDGYKTTSGTFDGVMHCLYLYNRALSDIEIKQLHIDPYSMFRQTPIWMFDYTSGGGSTIAAMQYYKNILQKAMQ